MSIVATQSSSFLSPSENHSFSSTTSQPRVARDRPEDLERALARAFTQAKLESSAQMIASQCGLFSAIFLVFGALIIFLASLLTRLLDDGTRQLGPYFPFVDFRANLRDALIYQQLERRPSAGREAAEAWVDWYLKRPLTISMAPHVYFYNNDYDPYRCPSIPQELRDAKGDERAQRASGVFFFTRRNTTIGSFLCYNSTLRVRNVTLNTENTLHADLGDGFCIIATDSVVCPTVRDLLFGLEVPGFYEDGKYREYTCQERGNCYIQTVYAPVDETFDTVLEFNVEFDVPAYDYSSCEKVYLDRAYDYSAAIRSPPAEGGLPQVDYWILGRRAMSTNFCKYTAVHEIHRTVPSYYVLLTLIYGIAAVIIMAPLIAYWVAIRRGNVALVSHVIRRREKAYWHYQHRQRLTGERSGAGSSSSQSMSQTASRSLLGSNAGLE